MLRLVFMATGKSKHHGPRKTIKTRGGSGAHGTKGTTPVQEESPKWHGGGPKGENEKQARSKP